MPADDHEDLAQRHQFAMLRFATPRARTVVLALLVLVAAIGVLAVSAVACEGVGGPPSSPPKEEQKGSGENPGSEKVVKCTVGDPVDCATGDETEQQTDISIGGRGPGLRIVRSYDALGAAEATEAGPWGYGWTGTYDASLTISAETVTVNQENGSATTFYKKGSEYTQGGWVEARLVKEGTSYIYTLPDQSKLEFNSEGKLIKETERNGNSNMLTYKEGKLEKVEDGDKRTLTFKYNGEGLVESVKDPMGHVVSYTYSSKQLASVTIEGKARWKFEYTSPHLLSKLTDGREHATTFEYNGSHQVTKEVHAGHERKWTYGTNETTQTEPNGSETLEKFNAAGEPIKEVRAKGKSEETVTEYEYNAETYDLVKTIDPNKHDTEYGYDSEGNKTSEKDPNGDERKWKYDKKHDIETETTPEGETTTIKRNAAGEPEAIERPAGSETQKTEYKYDAKGDLEEEVDPLGHKTKYTYDAAGDKETEKDPEGDERKWKYNEDSQETEETSARGYTTKTERDERGLPTKVTDPLGHTTEYKYDGDQNIEAETDGNGHTTKYEYNEENQPTKVTEPNGDHPETEYDSEGKMVAHIDGNGHKWEYKRNALEQVTEEKNPLGKIWKKTYEKAGNLEKLEDPEKHTTEYGYDESDRLKKIKYSTGTPSEVTYEYNKDSKVTKMKDETGTTENTWDKLDRLTKYKNGAGKTVEYEYDLADLPTKITYPNGKAITRAYNADDLLDYVTDWNGKGTEFTYNADGELQQTWFPPGTEEEDEYGYNEADEMTTVEVHTKDNFASTLAAIEYLRGKDGEVEQTIAEGLPGPTISEEKYDEDERLTEANKLAYAYDKANNPTKIEGTSGYSYNEADELSEGPASVKYTYSEDGRRTEAKPGKGPATTYGYDQAGNLTAVKRSEEAPVTKIEDSYTYDGTNLRQTQTINGTKTDLTWDTAEEIPIILEDETNSYIYGPENLPFEQISSAGETLFLHHDQQGSTRLITNTKGEAVASYTYTPYGSLEGSTGTVTTPLRYDGQYTSIDTGLIYLRARTYDPVTGQFLTIDPALEATGEPYAYVKDNPENSSDPTGDCVSVWKDCDELEKNIKDLRATNVDLANKANAWYDTADGFAASAMTLNESGWAAAKSGAFTAAQQDWADEAVFLAKAQAAFKKGEKLSGQIGANVATIWKYKKERIAKNCE
jgi:RHS repeat-associated protein